MMNKYQDRISVLFGTANRREAALERAKLWLAHFKAKHFDIAQLWGVDAGLKVKSSAYVIHVVSRHTFDATELGSLYQGGEVVEGFFVSSRQEYVLVTLYGGKSFD